jgi:peptidoglycan/LPS O-acetylase OafA/YrhL
MFPDLPYPVKKLTNYGWHGVQLFFLMSCVTLLLSWRADEAKGRADVFAFWTRRFFRIAPLYYLAALLYFYLEPPPAGFDLRQLLASFTFCNAWYPTLIPTTQDRWMVVPGGWSIGVEFTFYLVFPLVATFVRSMRAALLFAFLAILAGCIANPLAYEALVRTYGETATENFLYFWFPNQLAVFAFGTILFQALKASWENPEDRLPLLLRRHTIKIALGCALTSVVATNIKFPGRLPLSPPLLVPTFFVASLIFMIFVLTLGNNPTNIFVNRSIRSFGKISFSAYIIHFAVVHKLPLLWPAVFDTNAGNWQAILAFALLWLAVVPVTYVISFLTYHVVEEPMIRLGRSLLNAKRSRAASAISSDSLRGPIF